MRLYLESGILPEGLTQYTMINPIKFEDTQSILEDLAKWLQGSAFDESPVLARREDLFRRRIQDYDENIWLVLELIAAHSRNPGDSVDYTILRNDFVAILQQRGHQDLECKQLFENARVPPRDSGLIAVTTDQTGQATVRMETQWWDLVLEELRNRARVTPREHT
jgi:hypothetical protein